MYFLLFFLFQNLSRFNINFFELKLSSQYLLRNFYCINRKMSVEPLTKKRKLDTKYFSKMKHKDDYDLTTYEFKDGIIILILFN